MQQFFIALSAAFMSYGPNLDDPEVATAEQARNLGNVHFGHLPRTMHKKSFCNCKMFC